ncbi:hypothetical protein W02_13520 [Nitrospira sp. KM1]|uniref:oligosaccharide flippase family protein n=1 Tax=Nitrospira sp. KM1 TaxID=1936990 RepID=UPI0013A7371D|nr:oligosaccharide flippase family protein [Nitrospira sp. KM1]BCA54212.1 hypothetical protein W02_13520 [Nitrospira sp. KM1]
MSTLKLSLIGFGARLTVNLVNVVTVILLARYLEPQGRGEYFLFQAMVSVLTVLGDLGLSQSANVFAGRQRDSAANVHAVLIRGVWLLWACLTGIGGSVLFFAGERLMPNFPREWQLAAFAVLPFTLYAGFWNSLMIGMGNIQVLNAVQLVMSPLQLLLVIVFVVGLSAGVGSAVLIYLLVMLLQSLVMAVLAGRFELRHGQEKGSLRILTTQMLSFGLRGYPGSLSTMLWMRIPVFLLNAFHGPVAVGIFSVAQQLAERVLLPMQAFQDAIYRKMSMLPAQEAKASMNRYLRFVTTGIGGVLPLGIFLAPWVIVLLFGKAYTEATQVFCVLLVGTAFVGLAMVLSPYLLGQLERPGLLSLLAGANAVTCLVLSLWLIPIGAQLGAAWALALTQLLGTMTVLGIYVRLAGTSFYDTMLLSKQDIVMLFNQIETLARWKRA